jgi:hypothetical protein
MAQTTLHKIRSTPSPGDRGIGHPPLIVAVHPAGQPAAGQARCLHGPRAGLDAHRHAREEDPLRWAVPASTEWGPAVRHPGLTVQMARHGGLW